mgnify:CR=1 FL=1
MLSWIFRTAINITLLGRKRGARASSLLEKPGITRIRPLIMPFSAFRATSSTEVVTSFSFFSGAPEYLAAVEAKLVLKSPGNNTVTVTPVP